MANAKAQINPIQLQSAELNLNKFDAEIKQYSGFNKNNSPFVGGCLSNLFTKKDSITGSNGDNVYIDKDGNIYKVTERGLFKNNQLLINFDYDDNFSNKHFWTETYLEGFDNAIAVFGNNDSYVMFYYENEHFYLKYKHSQSDYEKTYQFSQTVTLEQFYGKDWRHSICCLNVGNDDMVFILGGGNGEFVYFDGLDFVFNKQIDTYSYYNFTSAIYKDGYIFILDSYLIKVVKLDVENQQFVLMTNNANVIGAPVPKINQNYYASFILGNPVNKIFFHFVTTYSVYSYQGFVLSCEIAYYDAINNEVVLTTPEHTIDLRDYKYIANTVDFNNYNRSQISLADKTDFSILLNLNCQVKNSENESYKNAYVHILGDENYFEGCDFTEEDGIRHLVSKSGEMQKVGSFSLLFNNERLSGIAGNHCLFSGWNNLDFNDLRYYNYNPHSERIIYKQNNKFYVIEHSLPSLKVIGNQIVTNYDGIYNAYDINRNKVLGFAPAFNYCRGCHYVPGSPADPVFANKVLIENDINYFQTGLVGAAINEYKLEDNASLLLNPIDALTMDSQNFEERTFYTFGYIINIYIANDEGECLYNSSINPTGGSLKDSYLIGLPFPITTDGNVEYSPSLFSDIKNIFGNKAFIKSGNTFYPLAMGNNSLPVMSFYLAAGIDNISIGFIIQGQFYGIINNNIYAIQYINNIINDISFVVSVENLQFCGNSPYEALFYSKTNRCLYSFVGSNVLQQKQLVDKIAKIDDYIYNPSTQTIFLITDIGVIFYSIFGQFLYDKDIEKVFLLNNGVCFALGNAQYEYIKYYLEESDSDYIKHNINLETCFYGMNNETVTINDCLYLRLFSEEHEEGEIKISATTLSLKGRKTEETTFKIKASDWDSLTDSLYIRYQPKEQRGLGISFSIDSPFKIASLSVGSLADAVLIDKVSKGAINAPQQTSNNVEW